MMNTSNPFECGCYDGRVVQVCNAEERVRMVRGFTWAQCEDALLLEGLQKTVVHAIQVRLRALDREQSE